jgi:adenosylcobinamide-GDP ribazoletransferase
VQLTTVSVCFILLLGVAALAVHWSGPAWWTGPVAMISAAIGGVAVIRRATRRLGGITGDVLGAVIEVSLAVALTTSAVLLSVNP